ncbi:MAG: TonB-dependent receptor [Deltaproteobacteria bacterium]
MGLRRAGMACWVCAAALTTHARLALADDPQPSRPAAPPPDSLTVRGDRARAERERVEAEARFATSIDARERGARAGNVADILDDAPGVHARRTGDSLSPTSIAFRGAPTSHVTLALDGVVLNDAGGGGLDVSLIPPSVLERVDVYRGTAPARLGLGGLAGAVEFITRPAPRTLHAHLSAGLGSFLERRVHGAIAGRLGPFVALASVAYRGTEGRFTFYDDAGTPLTTHDDHPDAVRANNAGNAVDALVRACTLSARAPTCALILFDWRLRGMPGPGYAQLASPSLELWRLTARLAHRIPLARGYVEPFVSFTTRADRFLDRAGEVFPGRPIDARTHSTATEWGWTVSTHHRDVRIEGIARQRADTYVTAGENTSSLVARRLAFLGAADVQIGRGPLQVTGTLAAEVLHDGRADGPGHDRAMLSPRLAARVSLPAGFEIRATLAHLERSPTLVDLYGLPGFQIGNPTLVPERSDGGDLGLVWHIRSGNLDARAELVGYGRATHDMITLERRGPVSYEAFNLRDATVLGLESALRVAYGRVFELVASDAFTSAVVLAPGTPIDGRRPPGIPEHDLYARAQGNLGPVSAWLDVSFVSGIYLDEFNAIPTPARTLVGAGAAFRVPWVRGLSFTLTGSNMLDQRVSTYTLHQGADYPIQQTIQDFAGYPLPGRAVFAMIHYDLEGTP